MMTRNKTGWRAAVYVTSICHLIAVTGCTTGSASSVVPDRTGHQAQELQRLKEENAQLKIDALESQSKAWVATHKTELLDRLTTYYAPNGQQILEAHGFEGEVLDYSVTDAEYKSGVLFFEQSLLWRKADRTGAAAQLLTGLDVATGKPVCNTITALTGFTRLEMESLTEASTASTIKREPASALREQGMAAAEPQLPATESSAAVRSGFYERNRKDIDHALIIVGTAGELHS